MTTPGFAAGGPEPDGATPDSTAARSGTGGLSHTVMIEKPEPTSEVETMQQHHSIHDVIARDHVIKYAVPAQ